MQFAEHRQENFGHCEAHEGDSHHNNPVLRAVFVDVGGGAEYSDARNVADGNEIKLQAGTTTNYAQCSIYDHVSSGRVISRLSACIL